MFDYDRKVDFETGNTMELCCALAEDFPLFFGHDIETRFAATLQRLIHEAPADQVFLLTDSYILELFGGDFFKHLKQAYPQTQLCLLPRGEKSKTFDVLQALCDELIEKGVSKRSLLVAFGGGAIGNITGLAAGLVFRGIRFVEVPTTLSHQTDGILSNKQAVNGRSGKNHFGLYHAPVCAWVDTAYLETEPLKFKKSGIVEGIKNGLIDQPAFIPYLERHVKPNGGYAPERLNDLCYKLIVSKLKILEKDPTEKQYGIILEYGHTFAHAVEWLCQGELTHGEAVSIGMKIAAELSAQLGFIDRELVDLHYRLIDKRLGIRPSLPDRLDAAAVLETMKVDNKKTGGDIRYVLLTGLGRCHVGEGDYLVRVDEKIVRAVIDRFLNNYA